MYKHALDALKGPERKLLEEEFRRLFVATSLQELIVARRNVLVIGSVEGLEYLGTYAEQCSPALSTFIVGIWSLAQQCQPLKEPGPGSLLPLMRQKAAKKSKRKPRTVKPPTHEEVINEIQDLLEGLEKETRAE